MCVFVLSYVQLSATPWTVAHKAPLSMEFSRQEYWRGLPFPTPGDIPNPEIEPDSLASPALACRHAKSLQSCPTLCDPMDSGPPGSSVHRIL